MIHTFRKYHISTSLSTGLVSHPPIGKLGMFGRGAFYSMMRKEKGPEILILQGGFG